MRSKWLRALYSENCALLNSLLKSHHHLVLDGWDADPSLRRDGAPREPGTVDKWMGCTVLHAAASRGSLELVTTIVELFTVMIGDREWFLDDQRPALEVSGTDLNSEIRSLSDLLAKKDGRRKVEALAIATINGNRQIMAALMKASLSCKSNPYEVDIGWKLPSPESLAKSDDGMKLELLAKRDDDMRLELRHITEEAMASLSSDEKTLIEAEYVLEGRFNALPLEENLFHFTFSDSCLDAKLLSKVRKEILSRVSTDKNSAVLWRFLELDYPHDGGEGDPALQLARDPSQPDEGIPPPFSLDVEDEDAMDWTMMSRTPSLSVEDGADRTRMSLPSPWYASEEEDRDLSVETMKGELRTVTEEFMASLRVQSRLSIQVKYARDEDFNFLPLEEYLFHFSFTQPMEEYLHGVQKKLWKRIEGHSNSLALRRFVMLELRDGRGRTVLHVAADGWSSEQVRRFLSLVPEGEDHADWVNPRDAAGRTPLYMAASAGSDDVLRALLTDSCTDLNVAFTFEACAKGIWDEFLWQRSLGIMSKRNGFGAWDVEDLTALQIAILLKEKESVRVLLEDRHKQRRPEYRLDVTCTCAHWDKRGRSYSVEPLALAVAVGDASIVQLLLKDPRVRDLGRPSNWWGKQKRLERSQDTRPALHRAAASGKFDLVKLFLDAKAVDTLYDPFVKDYFGDTAMHHATEGEDTRFFLHLLHCAHADQARQVPRAEDITGDQQHDKKIFIERQGCVELLLQAGLDVWRTNDDEQAPYPSSKASPEFLSWWYKKLAIETLEEQKTLNAAASAISVTAALVATASYVGPLQPPLGFTMDSGVAVEQVHNIWVRIFIACNTLSFYLAVAAIMLAVIPALPIPHQAVRMEIQHTRRIVTFAVGFLFPSIISVLIAFAAGSMAGISSGHGGLKMSSSIVGGLACLIVIYLFSIRLLGLVFHRNTRVKKLYGNSLYFYDQISLKWRESTVVKKSEDSGGQGLRTWKVRFLETPPFKNEVEGLEVTSSMMSSLEHSLDISKPT